MNLSATSKPPGIFATLFIHLSAILKNFRHRLESCVPAGYEDETGFHFGVEKSLKD